MQVDLPALERPTKAISGTSKRGKCFSSGAVVKNLAVCSQPIAIFGSGRALTAASGAGEGAGVIMVRESIKKGDALVSGHAGSIPNGLEKS